MNREASLKGNEEDRQSEIEMSRSADPARGKGRERQRDWMGRRGTWRERECLCQVTFRSQNASWASTLRI